MDIERLAGKFETGNEAKCINTSKQIPDKPIKVVLGANKVNPERFV